MTTTPQITNIAHMLDLGDYVGEFVADYDMDAVRRDYVAAVNERTIAGVVVCENGDVIADVDVADTARSIDWSRATENIDVEPILERHDRTLLGDQD